MEHRMRKRAQHRRRADSVHPPVDENRDHAQGKSGAEITLVEYGSFNCQFCRSAHEIIASLSDRFDGQLCYVFRHFPLSGDAVARRAAELAEYAYETTGHYWQVHDAIMKRGATLKEQDLDVLAAEIKLPLVDAAHERAWRRAQAKVRRDIESAARSGALVTPTFFVNNRRYEGAWDEASLAEAMLGSPGQRMQAAALDFARWAPSTGVLLLVMTIAAIILVNSAWGAAFAVLLQTQVGWVVGDITFSLPLQEWINDGLLTIFFLAVGLEIKREFTVGRLASRRAAALPIAAAIGGMLFPAAIYLLIAPPALAGGWAIPTTTDTAFAVALIALMGSRVPVELRIFLTAAVIIDDLAAIAIVATFYSSGIDPHYLAASILLTVLLIILNRSNVYRPLPYAVIGVVLWASLHGSGLHATLTGLILAMATPTRPPPNLQALVAQAGMVIQHELRNAGKGVLRQGPSEPGLRTLEAIHDRIESPAAKLLRSVEPWSSYVVLPIFALANAGLVWSPAIVGTHETLVLAIVLGLVIGKPLGMLVISAVAVRWGLAVKPTTYSWHQLAGAGALAGIGFTMSLYIGAKAFPLAADFAAVQLGVFIASILSGTLGSWLLWRAATPKKA